MKNELFSNPSSLYRPAPLWVWNDLMTKEQMEKQLIEMKKQGFGGAFVHPRPGLITEYLSDDWFNCWETALEISKGLDMKLYIYDENSYPSGFAGGHVPSQLPDCVANAIVMREYTKDTLAEIPMNKSPMLNRPGHPVSAFAYEQKEGKSIEIIQDLIDIPVDEWGNYSDKFLVFELGHPHTNAWHGGFAYVDLLRPEVTQVFIETTYKPYKEKFGNDFGDHIPALFTDEPAVSPGTMFETTANILPFSYWFASQFEDMNGYDLKDFLPGLFFDIEFDYPSITSEKVRYDYYHTVHELWVKNFVKPLSDWCEQNNIAFTGHYLEHDWPYPWGLASPSVMSLYEYMHWPAIDMLLTHLLRKDGTEPLLMLTVKEAQSVANQFQKERVLCETYGAGGWDSTFEDYKRIGDWLYVHGINFMNQHLTFSTIVGARKRDHPQSFDWRQPWWEEYKELNDYYSRLSYTLSQGVGTNDILVIHPTTSFYLQSPNTKVRGKKEEDIEYLGFVQGLMDSQVGFDLGDEYIIKNHGSIKGKNFCVNKSSYNLVVIPPNVDNLMQSTVNAIETYLREGGKVVALSQPKYIEGRTTKTFEKLQKHANWIELDSLPALYTYLDDHSFINVKMSGLTIDLPKGVAYLSRQNDDGSMTYFIVNSNQEDVPELTICLKGQSVEKLNPWNGEVESIAYSVSDGEISIPCSLPGVGSILLRVYPEPVEGNQDKEIVTAAALEVEVVDSPTSITVEEDNYVVLDYVHLMVGNKGFQDLHVLHAQKIIYEHHGFEMNPWDNAVQFKKRLVDRQSQLDDLTRAGFIANYDFTIQPGTSVGRMKLLVERPELYTISVNGKLINFDDAKEHSLDQYIKAATISDVIQDGENTVTVETNNFNIHMELEPIYLAGDFGVRDINGKWTIVPQPSLQIGDWKEQGYPFYSYAVQYKKTFEYSEAGKRVFVKLNEWEGTAASVMVNGQPTGVVIKQGERKEVTSFVNEGENEVIVRVSGSMKNLLGPHHDPSSPRKTAWPGNWKKTPRFGNAEPESYDLISTGLLEDFVIEQSKN